jgi:hypothetical protein
MLTSIELMKNAVAGHTTRITTTLFDVIVALQEESADEKTVVSILEHMIASGRIRFSGDGAHSN